MPYHFARHLIQPPAHCAHLAPTPGRGHSQQLEQHKQVVGQPANAKEDGIGRESPTRKPFHAKATLQFFDSILTGLTSLGIPLDNLPRGTLLDSSQSAYSAGGVIADAAPWRGQGRIELPGHIHRMQKLPEQHQASMGGELLVGGLELERQNGLWHHWFHLVGEEWLSGWAPIS